MILTIKILVVLVNLLSLIKDIFNLKIGNNQMIKSVKEYMHEVSYFLKSWSMIKNIKKMRVQNPQKRVFNFNSCVFLKV